MNLPEIINAGALTMPVRAQLYNYGTGLCWQGTYNDGHEEHDRDLQGQAVTLSRTERGTA